MDRPGHRAAPRQHPPPSVPPRVEYTLTELGATLLDSVTHLAEWATTHRRQIAANRRRYDTAHQDG
ncbi:winged helix-turn-helix transcriptional regulator [Amycolatopsis sp. lyj-346]|uniref:winged helix-turn-helix transcriptional regulator n=1 Tax=Amycolatopsis sp. lyj-346 TaxID=2789289 RepID=UPI00397B1AA6